MTQVSVTVIVSLVGIGSYATCALWNRKTFKEKDLLAFGLWCGAVVSGVYMVLSSIGLLKADEGTTRIYVCIFGAVLVFLSVQEGKKMILAALTQKKQKPATQVRRQPESAGLLPPTEYEIEKEK